MIRPISCKCGTCLGWYEVATGVIVSPKPPPGLKMFGVYFHCENCLTHIKFDGPATRRTAEKLRLKELAKKNRGAPSGAIRLVA